MSPYDQYTDASEAASDFGKVILIIIAIALIFLLFIRTHAPAHNQAQRVSYHTKVEQAKKDLTQMAFYGQRPLLSIERCDSKDEPKVSFKIQWLGQDGKKYWNTFPETEISFSEGLSANGTIEFEYGKTFNLPAIDTQSKEPIDSIELDYQLGTIENCKTENPAAVVDEYVIDVHVILPK